MFRFIFALLLFLIYNPITSAYAQDSTQKFDVKTDMRSSVEPPREGSPVIYTVNIEWWGTDENQFKLIPPNLETKGLSIENTGVSTESVPAENGNIKQVRTFTFELLPTRRGTVSIEPFPVEYLVRGRTGTQQLEVPGRTFQVKGAPIHIPWLWIGITGGGISILGLIVFTIVRIHKSKKAETKVLDPHRDTLVKIAAMNPLLKSGDYSDYVTKLAREFSIYLKDVQGLESTDYSAVEKNHNLTREDKNLLIKIIEEMTELKYSKEALSPSEVNDIKRLVEQFIESKKVV